MVLQYVNDTMMWFKINVQQQTPGPITSFLSVKQTLHVHFRSIPAHKDERRGFLKGCPEASIDRLIAGYWA